LNFVKSLGFCGLALLGAAALSISVSGVIAALGGSAQAGGVLEERKLPVRFA